MKKHMLPAEHEKITKITPLKTNMTMENPPFEDVFPIENGDFHDFPMSCQFSGVYPGKMSLSYVNI